jgi:ubiquinone/menaquinone biosynthesis C-methylase UbiE
MLFRVLEPEAMDSPDEARDYDSMDHSVVNHAFATEFLALPELLPGIVLDVGTGTAQIPLVMCRLHPTLRVVGIDLSRAMLSLAERNIAAAQLNERVRIEVANANHLQYGNGRFAAVVSNTIIHHIPDPFGAFSEMARVCQPGGWVFVRDLIRPESESHLTHLVEQHTTGATPQQRQLFADSLRAALTIAEVQSLVGQLGFPPATVTQTSDRHWTFRARSTG